MPKSYVKHTTQHITAIRLSNTGPEAKIWQKYDKNCEVTKVACQKNFQITEDRL
ncbi:5463_t:CDS:2 [Diversispora eburnea]|uniref:5463_t:CDS:1 n=1 Tax=Diversispora eburnea TaxID=1213867 RepID=A0A9N9C9G2_9GLOM|nr:5463_t:CDS:2 [Diversispora eburnea]